MIQGGDTTAGNGTGGKSIYPSSSSSSTSTSTSTEFEDENLDWRDLDTPGLVCMANRGKDTNSSQFFITLDACPHLNGKHTVFGHLVAGQEVLDKMAKVAVDDDDKPLSPVLVERCGELERKRRSAPPHRVAPEQVVNRGRKRSSLDDSAAQTQTLPIRSPSQERVNPSSATSGADAAIEKRKRRQSDNHIDETLRGRPRARSDDESAVSNAVSSDERSRSPNRVHKRQRSPSPSRLVGRKQGVDRRGGDGEGKGQNGEEDGDGYERRRRKSLPNQYREDSRLQRRDSERRGGDGREDRGRGDDRRDDRRGGPRDWDDPRSSERRDERRDDDRRPPQGGYNGRQQDNYRPGRDNRNGGGRSNRFNEGRLGNDGRLDGAGGAVGGAGDGAIKFKGRGSMKYREPDRRW